VKVGMYEGDIETVAFAFDDARLLGNPQKILCGEQHFEGALGVDFKVAINADQLP
jgi:hypothetical protein